MSKAITGKADVTLKHDGYGEVSIEVNDQTSGTARVEVIVSLDDFTGASTCVGELIKGTAHWRDMENLGIGPEDPKPDLDFKSRLHQLGVLSLLAQCSVHVSEELREAIVTAMGESPLVSRVRRRINRIDFTTHGGADSFEDTPRDSF